jgi:fructose/tagatose bisphosphate aldolase
MVKVNIGTALNAAFTGAVRDTLAAAPATVDLRFALTAARRAMADAVTSAQARTRPATGEAADRPGAGRSLHR